MRHLILFLALLGVASAWTNDALPEVMQAQYEYDACNVQFAKDFVQMRESCGTANGVSVFDSSGYISDLEDALADVKAAADRGNQFEFNAATWTLKSEAVSLVLAIIGDALTNKTAPFFSCVQDGTPALNEELTACKTGAFQKGKTAATDYVNNELEFADGEIAELDAFGADTAGMRQVVTSGGELVAEIGPTFDSGDEKGIQGLYQRHARLVLLFRLEKMVSVMDYTGPIIAAGNNRNKDDLLDQIPDLRDDTDDLLGECAYSSSVDSGYALRNVECWNEGLVLMGRFNSLQLLYWQGV